MDIAVAAFYLLNEAALGVVGVAHERPITDVIGKGGKEKAVLVLIEVDGGLVTVDGHTLFVYYKNVKSQRNNMVIFVKSQRNNVIKMTSTEKGCHFF